MTDAPERSERDFEYDVCLSFAGEDRRYVGQVAAYLRGMGIRVFYDDYEEVELWGKDLFEHLDQVYGDAARYCVLFVSKHYARKLWTNHERRSAQERALKQHREYILPARFDDTKVPGLRTTVGYIDLSKRSPSELGELIHKKVGDRQKSNYLPPVPDRLYKALNARRKKHREAVYDHAYAFLQTLQRMTTIERALVTQFLYRGCPAELPENVHINIDLLRRLTGVAPTRIKRNLGKLRSLGVEVTLREDDETPEALGRREMLVLTWFNGSAEDEHLDESTSVAHAMVNCGVLCTDCAAKALQRLDFGQLSSVTAEEDEHGRPSADSNERTNEHTHAHSGRRRA